MPGAVMQGDRGDCAMVHSTIERGSVRSDMARVGGSGKHSQLNDAEEGVEASFCWEKGSAGRLALENKTSEDPVENGVSPE